MIAKILLRLFFLSLLAGQVISYTLGTATLYLHDIILFLLMLVGLVETKNIYKKFAKLEILRPIAGFILIGIVSLLINRPGLSSNELWQSSLYLWRWGFYSLIIAAVGGLREDNFGLKGLYFFGLGLGWLGLLQFIFYPDLRNLYYLGWDPHYYRLFSTLLDPNFSGIVLVVALLLGFYFIQQQRLAIWLGQVIIFIAIILTYSRATYLALIAGLVIWILRQKKIRQIGIIGIISLIIVLLIFPKPSSEGGQLLRTVSTLARVGNYERSWELIRQAPLFGWGFNTLRFVSRQRGWALPTDIPSQAAAGLDNSFLFVAATTGMIGSIIYLWLIVSLVKLSLNRKIAPGLTTLYLGSLVSFGVHGFFNNSLFYPWVMLWLWILTGQLLIRDDK